MKYFSLTGIPLINLFLGLIFIVFNTITLADPQKEMRCGWFENSSPSNASLTDKDGEWTISIQGGYEAKGDWPTFKKTEWVNAGVGSYGYGCACLKVTVNKESQEIIEIYEAHSKSLSGCRLDKTLKKP